MIKCLMVIVSLVALSGCGDGKKPITQRAADKVIGAKDAVSDAAKKKADSIENMASDRLKLPE